jgi:hypothetical protein
MALSREAVLAERLRRQGLLKPVETPEEYAALFKALQPVSPPYFSYPGSPPSLVHRAAFDDQALAADWRQERKIVKGRFLGGTIGYVFSEDLGLYANAFQRPLERLSEAQELVFNTLQHVGPLAPRQIKEETGLLNKEIMPILHRLQEAFLVYEDQVDSDWERAWQVFSQEWPGVSIQPDLCERAAKEVLRRFLHAYVFASVEQIKSWSGWPAKDINHLLKSLEANGVTTARDIDGLGDGWICAEDAALDCKEPLHSVFMLHKADPLVRASTSELKRRFVGLEVLQYLLVDGEFQGAVCGHWRIGPHDVENIVLQLPERERMARKDEIVEAVAWRYHPPTHHILRYDGQPA